MAQSQDETAPSEIGRASLYAIFFVSGFCSLIYQVVWQRVLFSIYGVNIESITIIVSIFMLGLGFGSLVGGEFSKRYPKYLAPAFAGAEIIIGLFGLVSLGLMHLIGSWTTGAALPLLTIYTMLLLFIPTLFMGATLPILVAYLNRSIQSVGSSVSSLYFINTIGAGLASIVTVVFFFEKMGQAQSIYTAAKLNFAVALYALALVAMARFLPRPDKFRLNFKIILALSAMQGFVALSYEILWMRVYSFASGSLPHVFGVVLGVYLIGIAVGSALAKPLTRKGGKNLGGAIGFFFVASNLLAFALIPILGKIAKISPWSATLSLVIVFLSSLAFGAIFPLLSEAGIDSGEEVGKKISYVYIANIIGSTLGSFFTGFIFLDKLSLGGVSALTAIIGLSLGAVAFAFARTWSLRIAGVFCTIFLIAKVGGSQQALHANIYEELLHGFTVHYHQHVQKAKIVKTIENRHGVINVDEHGVIYGNGMYDGVFNTSPVANSNHILRAYKAPFFNPRAKKVLMIGLSTGSWAQVIAGFPGVEELTVIEINDGYLELIPQYAPVKSLLTNPKVKILIDDGRRYLNSHKDAKYDMIIMNTTYHWRSNATNILSKEFLQIVRAHLNINGVAYYNTTASDEVVKTAIEVFPHFSFVGIPTSPRSMIVVSDQPFAVDRAYYAAQLRQVKIDGRMIFDNPNAGFAYADCVNFMISGDRKWLEKEMEAVRAITDDNMSVEFKYLKKMRLGLAKRFEILRPYLE